MYENILFVDFDGTITTEETLDGAMRLCIEPALYEQELKKMLAGERTLKQTVLFAFENIPSSRYQDIMAYVRGVPMRAGFGALLDEMGKLGFPVVVISGGLKPYVEEMLAPYRDRLLDVYSVELDTSGPYMKLSTPYEGEGDLLEKRKVMARYDYKRAICVGDGYTDVHMAMHSQLVFARDTLAKVLEEKGIPFRPWKDFYDVLEGITSMI